MKRVLGLAFFIFVLLAAAAKAAEYQGKNTDGRKFTAKAYSYETGGVYNVQVQFKQNQATPILCQWQSKNYQAEAGEH